jgi:phenylacetate-coenzyme A ligase PaaK-like adenylate-forming protein
MIRDVEHETMPREDLEDLQLKRLPAIVEQGYHLVPFYRRGMEEMGVKPEHIRSPADLKLLPFTTKQDLRDNYSFGMFAVPLDQVVRIHASSGTTGGGERLPLPDRSGPHADPRVAPHYQLIVDREGQLDTLEVQMELDQATFSDKVKQLQALPRPAVKPWREKS